MVVDQDDSNVDVLDASFYVYAPRLSWVDMLLELLSKLLSIFSDFQSGK